MDECARRPLKKRPFRSDGSKAGGIGLVYDSPQTENSAATSVCRTTRINARLIQRENGNPERSEYESLCAKAVSTSEGGILKPCAFAHGKPRAVSSRSRAIEARSSCRRTRCRIDRSDITALRTRF